MKNNKNTQFAALLTAFSLMLICGALTNIIGSGAWLTFKGGGAFEQQYSNYSVGSTVKFGSVSSDAYTTDTLIDVDVVNSAAPNYIDNMNISVSYQGKSMAYLRVKLIDEWTSLDEFKNLRYVLSNTAQIKYKITDPNWFDNRKIDGYFYYTLPLGGAVQNDGTVVHEVLNLPLLDGMEPGMYTPDPTYVELDLRMRMALRVEAVQVNRIKAFWGEGAHALVMPYTPAE